MKSVFSVFSTLTITVIAIVAFSHLMIDFFGVSVPNLFWPVFKDIGAWMILGIAFVFAVSCQIVPSRRRFLAAY